ncbi:UTP--glucose-1-phosphate uridylyltransferase [Candidatus Saccharibacteria bacterium]|nr:UTP--glucose-1-phosphate uridylyltransferase [Candidatus Saccharibacteria bacterium]
MDNSETVKKAVIAAAGFGTRFLPQTKAMPKEMLPLVDKPIIQYIVEELVDAGIEDIVIVTGYHKRSIEDHFDYISADLVENLKQGGKRDLLEKTKRISDLANFAYIRQKGPYGSATPVMNAAHLIGNEPFIYTFADDLVPAKPNRFKQMIDLHNDLGGPILPCIRVKDEEQYKRYGILAGDEVSGGIVRMSGLVEKPGKENAPSDLASVGGYLLTPDVFEYIDRAIPTIGDNKEFYLTTYVLEPMIRDGKPLFGCALNNSRYYDTGNKLEYLKTVVEFAVAHPELGPQFKTYLESWYKKGNL